MNSMTLERAHQLHKRLWHWLAMNPGMEKYEWPEWKDNGGPISWCYGWCFSCKIAEGSRLDDTKHRCRYCPVIWPVRFNGYTICAGPWGLWTKWKRCFDPGSKTELARQIRDIPWKYEVTP